MQITPFTLVTRSAHYDASKWPQAATPNTECQIDVFEKLRRARVEHQEYVTHLARMSNEMAVCDRETTNTREQREVAELALRGVQLLCAWTADVIETVSWKLVRVLRVLI